MTLNEVADWDYGRNERQETKEAEKSRKEGGKRANGDEDDLHIAVVIYVPRGRFSDGRRLACACALGFRSREVNFVACAARWTTEN